MHLRGVPLESANSVSPGRGRVGDQTSWGDGGRGLHGAREGIMTGVWLECLRGAGAHHRETDLVGEPIGAREG